MELSLPFPRRAPHGGTRQGTGRRASPDTRVRRAFDWLLHDRLALRCVICALVTVPLLGGGWLWLRDSSLVSVRHVHITGVHGEDALEIRQALDIAALRMTTMHFNAGALRSAVSSFAIVGGLRVTTSFPHSVSIAVTERPPVAALVSAGQRTAVASDGTVLGPGLLSSSLPTISGSTAPPVGARLREASTLEAVTVLGAAPAKLAAFVVRVYNGPEGLTVSMRNGLLVYFGDSARPHAKWLSLARVLVSPSAAGAVYIDVRLPERPAAGFSLASGSSTSTPAQGGASEPTAAALVASLSKAAGGSTGAATGSTSGSEEAEHANESETNSGSSGTPTSSESESSSRSTEASPSSVNGSSTPAGGAASSESNSSSEALASPTGGASSTPATGG